MNPEEKFALIGKLFCALCDKSYLVDFGDRAEFADSCAPHTDDPDRILAFLQKLTPQTESQDVA